eukprot:TRINITY_DN2186_c0_g2_i2.p1 TRINITY_DN2186_c0_g2~~TRINITY_DN2186_c0_g2_i2.p1  ORF type:complete len:339 (-),score=74.07 TRINITY_DN2186_c0_g2_i2:205-1221(-)
MVNLTLVAEESTPLSICDLDTKNEGENYRLAAACSSLAGNTWNGEVILMTATEAGLKGPFQRIPSNCGLSSVRWVSDNIIVAGRDDGALNLWTLGDNGSASEAIHFAHDDVVTAVDVSGPAANLMYSTSYDGVVKQWDMSAVLSSADGLAGDSATTAQFPTAEFDCGRRCESVACAREQSPQMAVVGAERLLLVWDARQSGDAAASYARHDANFISVDYSAANAHSILAITNAQEALIYDLRSLSEPVARGALGGPANQVCWSNATDTFVANGQDSGISLYKIKDNGTIELDNSVDTSTVVTAQNSRAVRWIPGGNYVLCGGGVGDEVVRLYRAGLAA